MRAHRALLLLLGTTAALAGAETDYEFDLDDDNVEFDAEGPEEDLPLEDYVYDPHAVRDLWARDLVWDDARDAAIRERHEGFVTTARPRRLEEDQSRSEFLASLSKGDPNEEVSCFIGYKSLRGRQEIIRAAYNTTHAKHDFDNANSIAVRLPKWKLLELLNDGDIDFVEKDEQIYPDASQVTPYGIAMTQGGVDFSAMYSGTTRTNNCWRSRSFKVAIIDSGYLVGHPDLPCGSASSVNCMGASFGLSSSETWYNPTRNHGTHVAGTIGALGSNNIGVVGMVPDSGICYLIGRVFGDSGGSSFSMILAAYQWALGKGAHVINMSLSGDSGDTTSERVFYNAFYQQNRITVAAAGNDGSSVCRYPACYSSVVSVAAVDQNNRVASFSNYNSMVDLAAPGVNVLSTVPGSTSASVYTQSGASYNLAYMTNSQTASQSGTSAKIVFCNLGTSTCSGVSGSICLIQRGGNTFQQKALNCQNGGGSAAIIYNNGTGYFTGFVPSDGTVRIPVFSADYSTGNSLRSVSSQVQLTNDGGGYAYLSGTSMATPHVTGAAALIWRSCPSCKNQHVVSCLHRTAKDLGASGKDAYYGSGLIQTSSAYTCLRTVANCC